MRSLADEIAERLVGHDTETRTEAAWRMGKLDDLMRSEQETWTESVGVGVRTGSGVRLRNIRRQTPARWQGVTKSKTAVEIPVEKLPQKSKSTPRRV